MALGKRDKRKVGSLHSSYFTQILNDILRPSHLPLPGQREWESKTPLDRKGKRGGGAIALSTESSPRIDSA